MKRIMGVVGVTITAGAAIGYCLKPTYAPPLPEITTANVCDMYGRNVAGYYVGLNKVSFIGNEAFKSPSESEEQSSWLIIDSQIGNVHVRYFNTQESQWEERDLVTLSGISSDIEIESPEGYSVVIKTAGLGQTMVFITGGICMPKEMHS